MKKNAFIRLSCLSHLMGSQAEFIHDFKKAWIIKQYIKVNGSFSFREPVSVTPNWLLARFHQMAVKQLFS